MAKNNVNFGKQGQFLAEMFLMKHGFNVIFRNFRKKFGEVDLIALYGQEIHFIEVKSVSRITFFNNNHMPEENVNDLKIHKIRKVADYFINQYSMENFIPQIDVVTVSFIKGKSSPLINFIENV